MIDRLLLLRLRPEVAMTQVAEAETTLRAPWGVMAVGQLGPGERAALERLAGDGAPADTLLDLVAVDGGLAVARFSLILERLREQAWLSFTLAGPDAPIMTLVPVSRGYVPSTEVMEPDRCVRLSRFAYLQQDGSTLRLASPAAPARALFSARVGSALLAAVSEHPILRDLAAALALSEEVAGILVSLLVQARLMEAVDGDGAPVATEEEALAQWEFHDLLMHQRSRTTRHGGLSGGVFPFLGAIPPLPAVKPPVGCERVPLFRPAIERLVRDDLTLTDALERRRSLRVYGDVPITAEELGEFLFRTARVRDVVAADSAHGRLYETSIRPYPSGGAAYDLEVYAAVECCAGLARGLYHYDPCGHALVSLPAGEPDVRALMRDAVRSAGLESPPQVLLILSSRFQRLSWKYRSIAYATTLKNAGVLYQTMYLVATAMGLAPCALGGGDAERFAAATGIEPLVESSVGEFLLGSAPTHLSSDAAPGTFSGRLERDQRETGGTR